MQMTHFEDQPSYEIRMRLAVTSMTWAGHHLFTESLTSSYNIDEEGEGGRFGRRQRK